MSTNLEYRARERRRKEKVGGGPAKLNEKKGDGDFKKKIVAAVKKWEMLSATRKVSEYDISSIKRVTEKFLEISRCSRAKQRQRNVQKSVLHVQSCFFAN